MIIKLVFIIILKLCEIEVISISEFEEKEFCERIVKRVWLIFD